MGATAIKSANLLSALAGKGLVGPQAMAASRLLDGVEFNDAYAPLNLDARIDAAKALYGEAHFAPAAPTPTPTPAPTAGAHNAPPGNGGHPPLPTSPFQQQPPQPTPPAPVPDLHNGARPQGPQPTEEEQFEKFFRSTWPGMLPERTTT